MRGINKTMWRLAMPLGVLLIGCGDAGTATDSNSASSTSPTSTSLDPTTSTSSPTTPTTSDSATNTVSDSDGTIGTNSNSDGTSSGTSNPTTTTVTTDPSTTDPGTTGDPSTGAVSASSSSGGGDSTTEKPICEPGDMMGGGMVEKSFIWIPSQDQTDVAKINTQTLVEMARYKVGPGGDSPSRTSVSGDGRFVVVNGRQTGRSVMIAANVEDCLDKNGNGMIETSQGPNNVLPWPTDECLLWEKVWPYAGGFAAGPRGTTWTPGTWDYDQCKYVNPKIWIGYLAPGGAGHFVRVAVDGTVEETIVVPNWNGQGYSPYGGALDPEFRPWMAGLRGEFIRINTDQNPITVDRFTPPGNTQSYGFTVDPDGNPWFAGCGGPVSTYNTETMAYTSIAGTNACHRGIAADEKYVWAASNGPCGLVQIDRATNTLVQFHNTAPCSTAIGVSIDAEKFVWLVDQEGWAWKIDPENVPAMKQVMVPGSHYVYSDMTGGQLNSILPQ